MASEHEDLYALLGVTVTATVREIERAYRVSALKVHPDKVGADNVEAAERFLRLTRAADVLRDCEKRAKYDEAHKAVLVKRERVEKLDQKRRQARHDLEERERAGLKRPHEDFGEEEVKRLREEGLRMLDEMMKQDEEERQRAESAASASTEDINHTLSLKWSKEANLSEQDVKDTFAPFGEIDNWLFKKRRAILIYKRAADAEKIYAKRDSFKNFDISWTEPHVARTSSSSNAPQEPAPSTTDMPTTGTSGFSFSFPSTSASLESLESDVLRRMRDRERMRAEALAEK
ncbi:hypothetical protein BC830DRAFT_1077166 [Chytriomyces sp. MP71]|nr:hypothetical protein BC830DRAFT_1077166 [Chytriomyces sp. MP71]